MSVGDSPKTLRERESLLREIGRQADDENIRRFYITDIARDLSIDGALKSASEWEQKGFGRLETVPSGYAFPSEFFLFHLSDEGLEEARRLRLASEKKSLLERITGETGQRLVNVGNFLVALLALVVAAIALLRTN